MNDTPSPTNLVPFVRDVDFLRARAREHVRAGRMLEASHLYRMIAGRDPADARGQMELAGVYSDMCAFELSNRLFFAQAQRGEQAAACFFGLGRNFYALRDPRRAQDCLLTALRLEPAASFAEEAESLLDSLDEVVTERPAAGHGRADKAIQRGIQALETGRPDSAVRWLTYALRKRGEDIEALTLLCFAHLNAGRLYEALGWARRAYRRDRSDVYALCAMTSALYALDHPVLCAKYLQMAEAEAELPQEIVLLCQTACEVGAHDMALTLLRAMQAERPYTPNLLHMLAAACWNTGQVRQATRHWGTLRRLDPGDLTAVAMVERALQKVAKGDSQEPPPPEEQCAYGAELPPEVAIEKLLEVQQTLRNGPEALQARFDEDAEFAAILAWGLTVRDENDATRGAMLSLLGSLQGERADRMLLGLLTDTEQSEAIKREAIGLLAMRGLHGPHYMESGGRVLRVMGRTLSLQAALPPNCERILQAAVDRLTPRYGDVVQEVSHIWLEFLRRRENPGAPLKRPRLWMTALECAYHLRCRERNAQEQVDIEALCARQGVSPRALRRRLRMLLQEEE